MNVFTQKHEKVKKGTGEDMKLCY